MNERSLLLFHNKTFLGWFKNKIAMDSTAFETLKWLSRGPAFDVKCWNGYDINNISFYTKFQDDRSIVQNNGVIIVAESMHFSSLRDTNPVLASLSYFGVIEDIWEIMYTKFSVPVFKCKWVDSNTGVRTDEFGMTLVNLSRVGYKDEPFIMAYQAKQVFYIDDPIDKNWSVALEGKSMHNGSEENQDTMLDIPDTTFSTWMPNLNKENEDDDVHATRNDHDEGIILDNVTRP